MDTHSPHFVTCAASPCDAAELSRVHLTAWLETYPNAAAGIDADWIRKNVGWVVTPEGVARWREAIEAAALRPEQDFCRIARSTDQAVGFLCGHRSDVATLGPMYVLARFAGRGIGSRLMDEYLEWVGVRPVFLWATTYNERAVRFYTRHGFVDSGERQLWKGRLPNIRMVRSPHPVATRVRTGTADDMWA
ncbi:GNAT family N-acetyltransferase [Kitasatospora aureofaciens]|uniref:GNAT family N-acetyltransferase n=1 Tax=Kitasatospora aureofaciens TaxID=1894 RepID=UPI001C484694|nr:GNAT family N-acetyltransferase [Kitasatospora aureofaciens]MBV6695661.1 GNAT family N-acetyltransferase [Kitasatospora aureofaciens]